jgi:Flp pilus assembly protein TadB
VNWSNFWVLVTGGVVTLFFGQIARHIERGGRRGRLRQEIRQELELIERLDDWPVFQERIRDQLHDQLAEYAPIPFGHDGLDDDLPSWRVVGWSVVLLTPIALVIAGVFSPTWWQMVGVGAGLGLIANIVAFAADRRRRRVESVEDGDPDQ